MIYLISVEYRYETLLKIGYTADENSKKRFDNYKMHNPKSVVLFKIPGGTEQDEKNLHHMFRTFLYPDYGNEWFNFDQSIIDFFTTHTTKESLENDLIEITTVDSKDIPGLHKEINRLVNRWLCLESDTPEKLQYNYLRAKQIIIDCRKAIRKDIIAKEDILPYLVKKYDISGDQQIQLQDETIDDNVSNFLFKFHSLNNFPAKMKLLCTTDLTDDCIKSVLNYLPLTYKLYYETLGPERCYAQGYNKTYLEREYKDMQFDKSQLRDEIYNIFEVGKRYIRSEVKETLKNLYTSLGYNKIPKANDLEKYFEIRSCQITNKETGKKDHSFEIIKRKEIY